MLDSVIDVIEHLQQHSYISMFKKFVLLTKKVILFFFGLALAVYILYLIINQEVVAHFNLNLIPMQHKSEQISFDTESLYLRDLATSSVNVAYNPNVNLTLQPESNTSAAQSFGSWKLRNDAKKPFQPIAATLEPTFGTSPTQSF